MLLKDTHKAVNLLKERGADERLAEGIVNLFQQADAQVATKEDVELLRKDLTLLKKNLTIKIFGSIATATATAIIVAAMGLML